MFSVKDQLAKIVSEKKLTAQRLREVLDYDMVSGLFTWKYPINNRIKVGDVAGSPSNGYINISVDGEIYGAHRLAWLHVKGDWPKEQIDHRDENRGNNAFENLREATASQNRCNRGLQSNNESGLKGVSWFPRTRKWRARIMVGRKEISLGYFSSKQEAHEAYKKAAETHHGQFANFGATDETRIDA